MKDVEAGAKRLAQVILGASHLVQSVVPTLLNPDNSELNVWKNELRETMRRQAEFMCSELAKCHGLEVLAPQGAMYSMIRISTKDLNVQDDMEFSSLLLKEENVFVLPGRAFGVPNAFRVVLCSPEPILHQAAQRIAAFCRNHAK